MKDTFRFELNPYEFVKQLKAASKVPCKFYIEPVTVNGVKGYDVTMKVIDESRVNEFVEEKEILTNLGCEYGYACENRYMCTGKTIEFRREIGKVNDEGKVIPFSNVCDEEVTDYKEYERAFYLEEEPAQIAVVTNAPDQKKKMSIKDRACEVLRTPKDRNDVIGGAIVAGMAAMAGAVVVEYRKLAKQPENQSLGCLERSKKAISIAVKKPKVWLVTAGMIILSGGATLGTKVYKTSCPS